MKNVTELPQEVKKAISEVESAMKQLTKGKAFLLKHIEAYPDSTEAIEQEFDRLSSVLDSLNEEMEDGNN